MEQRSADLSEEPKVPVGRQERERARPGPTGFCCPAKVSVSAGKRDSEKLQPGGETWPALSFGKMFPGAEGRVGWERGVRNANLVLGSHALSPSGGGWSLPKGPCSGHIGGWLGKGRGEAKKPAICSLFCTHPSSSSLCPALYPGRLLSADQYPDPALGLPAGVAMGRH